MQGIVQSGASSARPLANAHVQLFDATSGGASAVAQTTSGADGTFTIGDVPQTSGIYYVTATVDAGVVLLALLGTTLPDAVVINELTTVAGAYCAAQFVANGSIAGDERGLRIAAAMSTNLVTLSSGASSPVITSSPNGDQTSSWRMTNSLANVLAACVREGAAEAFFGLATPPGATTPGDTITAMANVARNPANRAGGLYALSKTGRAYADVLTAQPVGWTVAVKVNDSGSDAEGQMFGGPARLVFDAEGRVWITNNVVQGNGNSTAYSIVLDAIGRPATDASGKRISPFTGGGLLGPGFGIDLDGHGNVWIGDFGWGSDPSAIPVGGVSLFDSNANPLSPAPDGYTSGGVHRVQATKVDPSGNVWLASYGSASIVIYRNGNPDDAVVWSPGADAPFKPFGIAFAADGTAWVTNSDAQASGVLHLALTDGGIELLHETPIGRTLKGITVAKDGTVWIASGGDDHVYALDAEGNFLGGYQGGGLDGPWDVVLDGNDDVWVANFGPLELGSVFAGRLTQLAGADRNGRRRGDAITPQTGLTLPSEGAEVLLHNGVSLYGEGAPKCFIPMMRATSLNIDSAGNIWYTNNWKPNFDLDKLADPWSGAANPGGDAMVIFIGLASPLPPSGRAAQ